MRTCLWASSQLRGTIQTKFNIVEFGPIYNNLLSTSLRLCMYFCVNRGSSLLKICRMGLRGELRLGWNTPCEQGIPSVPLRKCFLKQRCWHVPSDLNKEPMRSNNCPSSLLEWRLGPYAFTGYALNAYQSLIHMSQDFVKRKGFFPDWP